MLQLLTNDYRMTRKKLLKSEALLTLSFKASFKANSAPTLHEEEDKSEASGGVGALFAAPAVLKPPVVWRLSRPNRAPQRTRRLMVQTFTQRSMVTSPLRMAVTGASLSSVR